MAPPPGKATLVKALDIVKHKDGLSALEEMDKKIRQRQKEARSHEKNKRIGKRRINK